MKVKLTDVAERITGNEDRYTTHMKYYLAGEHYDNERIAIYRKGIIEEDINILGFKFHFPFKSGDTVIMARNPHLKKAGMITYDGICSDASYILRTKDQNVLSERYLPLVFQNDSFWRWFEANKSGSVNYLLNWKTLKDYVFELPPIEEQESFANLIWACERSRLAYEKLIQQSDELVKSQFVEMFGDPIENSMRWSKMTLKDACEKLTDGTHFSPESFPTGQYKYITAKNIKADGYDFSNLTYVTEDVHRSVYIRCNPEVGDILYIKDGVTTGIAMINTLEEEFTMLSSVALLKYKRTLLSGQFLKTLMNYPSFYNEMRGNMGGAAITRLTIKKLLDTEIIIPPLKRQKEFEILVEQTDKSKLEAKQALESLDAMQKSLMRKHLAGE